MVGSERDDDDQPRSILASLWFRALVVILVLGVIAAVAVPYVLDVVNPPTKPLAKAPSAPTPPTMAPAPPVPPPAQATAPPSAAPSGPAAAPTPAPARPMLKRDEPPKLAETPKPVETPKVAEAPRKAPARVAATAPSRVAATGGPYWVQVGAFKDQATARRVAERLREQKYKVTESTKSAAGGSPAATPAPRGGPGADLYDVFVSGTAPADINTKLSGKGLAIESVAGGAVVKPSLPLREAVALSRDLAAEGLRVQVRRAGGAAEASAPSAASGDTFHRVRVGSFPDRATAVAVLRELEGKGYRPYIAWGSE